MAFRQRTTFVIGAGASAEFGLPIGTGLAAEIKKAAATGLAGSAEPSAEYMREFLKRKFPAGVQRSDASKHLSDIHEGIHTAVSIDAFIHRHRQVPNIGRLGKAMIALEVLKAEAQSTMSSRLWPKFYADPNHVVDRGPSKPKLVNPDYTWIGHFFRTLCDGIEDPAEVGKHIRIICFNYDRCIEHYLAETLSAAYRISRKEAIEVVETKFEIIHPYGYLGKIAADPATVEDDRVAFGYEIPNDFDIERISNNIRTYTEQLADIEQLDAIHLAMSAAQNIVFLGFGFNNQNMNLLRVKAFFEAVGTKKNFYSTGYGLYQQIEGTLKRRIMDLFVEVGDHRIWKERVHIEFGVGCEELFRIHEMDLASFVSESYEGTLGYIVNNGPNDKPRF